MEPQLNARYSDYMFISHAMPKNLQVDEVVRIGQGSLSAVSDTQRKPRKKLREGRMGDLRGRNNMTNKTQWRMAA
jgi:hypothetical protein